MISSRLKSIVSCALLGLLICTGCEPNLPKTNSSASKDGAAGDTDKSKGGASDSTGLKRLIILTNGDSPFWDACRQGLNAAEADLKLQQAGFDAVLDVNDGGAPEGQLAKLQQYATQSNIAGIGISATDADNVAIADQLRSLQKKGIKIVTIDSDIERSKFRDVRHAFIGTDNLVGGQVLGKCAKGLKPDGGEYVTFVGRSGAQNAIERIGGFAKGAGAKFESKDSMEDNNDEEKARENVRNAIQNHPKASVLVGIWSYNAPAIVDVVRQANRRKDFTIVTFDAEPTAISAMGDGNIDAMVVQNPFQMGYQGTRMLAALAGDQKDVLAEMLPKYGQQDGDLFDTGLKVVVPNADSALKADMFDKGVEFTTLEQFQGWLKKYGLSGS